MKRPLVGLCVGFIQGIMYIVPMVLKGHTWKTNVPALTLWVIAGFFIATSYIKLHPVLKGILVSFIAFIPSIAYVVQRDPMALIPMFIAIVILGGLGGFVIYRFIEEID